MSEIDLYPGEEHRFVLVLTGAGLSDQLNDADPEATGRPILYAKARSEAAGKTERIVNLFIDRLTAELAAFHPANTCLLRGFAQYPAIPSLRELFKLKAAAIAVYPMYKGLAQLVGMDILETGRTIQDQFASLKKHYADYDFFFVHIKKDGFLRGGRQFRGQGLGHRGIRPVAAGSSRADSRLSWSSPATIPRQPVLKAHSWHPNPVLIKAAFQRQAARAGHFLDAVAPDADATVITGKGRSAGRHEKFGEKTCAGGILGTFKAMDVLPLMMANALKFKKYGA